MNPYGLQVKYLAASGLVSGTPAAIKAVYTMHSSSEAGAVKFYNLNVAPTVEDVPVGQIDIGHQGSDTFTIPEYGVLFDKGIYVVLPANVTINVFYKDARYAQKDTIMAKSPAWQRKEGKDPEGGLNAKGRASYNKATGGKLKAPATNPKNEKDAARRKSFCSRMEGMKKKNTSSKTANDPDSRINKSLRAWKC